MMRLILASTVLATMIAPTLAQTPMQRCKAITEAMERLNCYDSIEETPAAQPVPVPAAPPTAPVPPAKSAPAPAAKTPAAEDPLITQAKASVVDQLRDPGSARFQNVKLRTVRGKQSVCGLVSAKNAAGFMTVPQPFAFDGEQAYLIIYHPGPANNTKLDDYTLTREMGERLRKFSRLCR
jgi:hypothetical protein